MTETDKTAFQALSILRQRLCARIDSEQFKIMNRELITNAKPRNLRDDLRQIIDESVFNEVGDEQPE